MPADENTALNDMTEADTCRRFVEPAMHAAGWSGSAMMEQYRVTNGQIVIRGGIGVRRAPKRADYLLRYGRHLPLAIVEAKAWKYPAGQGLEQAKTYARMLGVPFA